MCIRDSSYDVRFIAVNDGVDSQRGDGEGFAAIRNLFNEWYPRDTSKKVRTSLRQRGTSGKHLGKPPYGYHCDPNDKDRWILAVSYTHLDVYKRQSRNRAGS